MPRTAAAAASSDTVALAGTAAPPSRLRLSLHGLPRLLSGTGQELNPGTRKALALALLIVLEPGLRRSRAADLLWPEAEPGDARRNLRRDLFRLRQLGLPLAEGGGERLALEGCEGGEGAEAALALAWPLPGASAPLWLDGLDEAAGVELAQWVDEQRPLLHSRWLKALADEAGRHEARGDAAAAALAWRSLLADGAAGPGHAAARVALERLGHVHELPLGEAADQAAAPVVGAPAAPRPAALHPRSLPFIGRAEELATLRAGLAQGRWVLLDGVPGVGKTRLAVEALAPLGGVLVLRCRPEDSAVPYASALRGLHLLLEAAPEAAVPAWVRRDLAALVPQWQPRGGAGGGPLAPPERLQRAYRQALALLAEGNFGALLVDDWQWADEPSQALWEPQPPAAADGLGGVVPLPCVFASRSGELTPPALQRRRRWIDAEQALALRLEPLPEADAAALAEAVLAGLATAPTAEVVSTAADQRQHAELSREAQARSGGHPLFLIEHLRHLQSQSRLEPAPTAPGGAAATLPPSVHELLVARSRALGPGVRRVLEAAALLGDALELPLLAQVLAMDELAVAQAMEHAAAADLLAPAPGAAGRLRIAHDLLAQAVAESLAPVRRSALHGQMAQALAARPGTEPALVARQFDFAGRAAEAAGWHLKAAEVAGQRHAWGQALHAAEAALAASALPAERLHAQRLRARALRERADTAAAEAALRAAVPEALRIGAAAVLEVALERTELLSASGRADTTLAELAALESDPALEPTQRQRLLAERANALAYLGRHGESLPVLRAALAALPASALAERWALHTRLARNLYYAGAVPELVAELRAGLELARLLGDEAKVAMGLYRLGVVEREHGQGDAALALLGEAIVIARRIGDVEWLRAALATASTVWLDRMQLARAEAAIAEGEQAAPGWDSPDLEDVYDERRLRLHRQRGEWTQAWAVAERSLARNAAHGHAHCVLGSRLQALRLALDQGDAATARHHFDAAQALHGETDSDSLLGQELEGMAAALLHAEGRSAAALDRARAWLAASQPRRTEDRARVLAAAADAATASGEHGAAADWLVEAQALKLDSLNVAASILAAHWRHAHADGGSKARRQCRSAIEHWLDAGPRPMPEVAMLRALLAQS